MSVRRSSSAATGSAVSHPRQTIVVDDQHAGRRLDKFLRSRLKGVPAGLLFQQLRRGKLRVNGRRAEQSYRLVEGDEIEIPPLTAGARATRMTRPPSATVEALRRAVLYEDPDVLVVDKPAGLAVHRGTDVPFGVIETLRYLRPDLPELELGHRIDRDTSGVLVLAKAPSMLRHLHEMLRDREEDIERHYLAVVVGSWPSDRTVLRAPLLRRDAEVVVHPDGQRAETHVKVRRRVGTRATLVSVRLLTGRKHQIRVHLQEAGHPIVGDVRYGDPRVNAALAARGATGLHLHAESLRIPLPDGDELVVSAPVPAVWERLLGGLVRRAGSRLA
ncbi:RluA family pseudouridine synthase [Dietzia aurantiaca]|uniref:Pseudouridine synthase n=1 Tax=Dietzia aurantiaca TaxID=983873 RepID=A0ABV9PV56_9ACTN